VSFPEVGINLSVLDGFSYVTEKETGHIYLIYDGQKTTVIDMAL